MYNNWKVEFSPFAWDDVKNIGFYKKKYKWMF